MSQFKAVIFDLGGVVFSSPMQGFAKMEKQYGLEHNFLNKMIVRNGEESTWSKLEKGKIPMGEEFFRAFDSEIADAGAPEFSSKELMKAVSEAMGVNENMISAIEKLKIAGLKVAALTNNWVEQNDVGFGSSIQEYFHIFVESAVEGIQKPDPEIYKLTLERLEVNPQDAIFLDDIGRNLKSAKQLGITTIKVVDPIEALKELQTTVGINLL